MSETNFLYSTYFLFVFFLLLYLCYLKKSEYYYVDVYKQHHKLYIMMRLQTVDDFSHQIPGCQASTCIEMWEYPTSQLPLHQSRL